MGLVALTAAAYARMMRSLLPPGRLWSTDPDSVLSGVFLGSADELERVGGRAVDLLRESDPRTADELLEDYERELDLPSTGTLEERRARVVAHMLKGVGVRPADYREVLAPLLGQDAADVVVIERGRAHAIAANDDREIYRFFIYRDPEEPGEYDLDTAQTLVDSMAHSHTKGHVIESIDCLCDDAESLCDRDILGA